MNRLGLTTLVSALALVACDAREPVGSPPADGQAAETPAAAEVEARPSSTMVLESAARAFDRGDDLDAIRKDAERVLADEAASVETLDDARLLLSRVREKSGDKEGAIAIVEELLAGGAEGGRVGRREEAEKRLRKLLVGSDEAPASMDAHGNFAPVAKTLAGYFSPDESGFALIDVAILGSPWNESNDPFVGLRSAMRELRDEKCPLCSDELNLQRSISRADSWVDVPRLSGETATHMPNIDRSLTVMLFDLDRNRVPSRYDDYLAIPSAELEKRLASGDGLVAMRKREGKGPLVVLAAPRSGQLSKVQEAFSKMETLGDEPVVVALPRKLLAEEIQSVVRAEMPALKKCYETALKSAPEAAGKFDYKFRIRTDGTVESLEIEAKQSTLEPSFVTCNEAVLRRMTFPAGADATLVTYPMVFSPG